MKVTGIMQEEPWNFGTVNVREMITEAFEIAVNAITGNCGCTEIELLAAINHLRHAADELERSRLEMKYGVKR